MQATRSCVICSDKINVAGVLDCCTHREFCYSCIHKWLTEQSNRCPLCKRVVTKLACEPRLGANNSTIQWNRATAIVDPTVRRSNTQFTDIISFQGGEMRVIRMAGDEIQMFAALLGEFTTVILGEQSHNIAQLNE